MSATTFPTPRAAPSPAFVRAVDLTGQWAAPVASVVVLLIAAVLVPNFYEPGNLTTVAIQATRVTFTGAIVTDAPDPPCVSVASTSFAIRGGPMTKSELVDQVADRARLTKQDASRAIDALLATVEDALRRGSEVSVSGFGKFHVSDRGARMGVNPRTGERIQIAASRVPRFTAGSGLKSAVKGR